MSRFNQKSIGTKTINMAGGEAYAETPELALVSLLLTSFAKDSFYEKSNDSFDRLKELIGKCDKQFVAKAAVYARTKFGMRSISHVAASELAKHISGLKWAKDFYKAIVYRPDDIVEILAYHLSKNGKETNAMRKGLGEAFGKFDTYQLAKYRCENRSLTLLGAMKLMHPVPSERNTAALAALKKGELKSTGTWESALTSAGQEADSDDEKVELKKEAWTSLIQTRKIGYFALLKNLRNIIEQAPDAVDAAIDMLTDEKLIKKSLVLPFRFMTAYEEILKLSGAGERVRNMMVGISRAIDISLSNVPKFDGNTLVVLDTSSSMTSDDAKPAKIGRLFAAALVKANNADFMTFDTDARYRNINPNDTLTTIANGIMFHGQSTNFHSIFQAANARYDRMIILSDMQGWVGHATPKEAFNQYKISKNANPVIYSFDLKGYGTLQFPEQNVYALAGFSDRVFDVMKLLETDKKALINEINKIVF
jgi:60 kDa SS-A/Ro ribonucleoprotein